VDSGHVTKNAAASLQDERCVETASDRSQEQGFIDDAILTSGADVRAK